MTAETREKVVDVIYEDTYRGQPTIRRLKEVVEISRDEHFITFRRPLGQEVVLAIRVIREIREVDYERQGPRHEIRGGNRFGR